MTEKTTSLGAHSASSLQEVSNVVDFNAPGVLNTRLLHILQSSLDPAVVLESFHRELRSFLCQTGIQFKRAGADAAMQVGRLSRCRLIYQLNVAEEPVGEIIISRGKPFRDEEIRLAEESLGVVLYPLRNACLYQHALAMSREDALTGLGNRQAMEQAISRELELAQRHDDSVAVILIDVDEFKQINDTYGHQAGDRVLIGVADILRSCARGSDLLFRYAGDEFVVAMSRTTRAGAMAVASRIRQAAERVEIEFDDLKVPVRLSLGVAVARPGEAIDTVFRRADRALYDAKRAGRNQAVLALAR